MFQGHEEGVDDDAQGDEEVHKGIHYEQLHYVGKSARSVWWGGLSG